MAHTCPECSQYCTCQGDIDDVDFGERSDCVCCFLNGGDDDSEEDSLEVDEELVKDFINVVSGNRSVLDQGLPNRFAR